MKAAMVGAILWAVVALAPLDPNLGIGTIEKLFLLGPLVVVPMGLHLASRRSQWWTTVTATAVVASFLVPTGARAGMLCVPWLMTCVVIGIIGAIRLARMVSPGERDEQRICQAVGMMGLVVGGVGLLQSRAGLEPLGFHEPLVLLVAVHFHFAAFVTPLAAGEVVKRMRDDGGRMKWGLTACAICGSPMLAAGYVSHVAVMRLIGASLLVVALVIVAIWLLLNLRKIRPGVARVLLGVSAVSVVAAMAYASLYALADFLGQVWVSIPQMARTHGALNAVAFSVCGLWGWNVAAKGGGHVARA